MKFTILALVAASAAGVKITYEDMFAQGRGGVCSGSNKPKGCAAEIMEEDMAAEDLAAQLQHVCGGSNKPKGCAAEIMAAIEEDHAAQLEHVCGGSKKPKGCAAQIMDMAFPDEAAQGRGGVCSGSNKPKGCAAETEEDLAAQL